MGGFRFTFTSIFIWFLWFFSVGKPDLVSDKIALINLRSAIGGKTNKWNVNDSTPCNWLGVVCEKNRVTVLRLPADELIGVLPMGVFTNLTQLRTLSLRLNALTGKLPSDLEKCSELRNLYLQDNKFYGEIPEFLFKLHNLVRLNLARNEFSGKLSPEINRLKRLGTLFLENNMISGEIPKIDLPNLVQFNVSNNQFNGSIPMKLRDMKANSFGGNALCGGPLGLCPGERIPSSPGVEGGEEKGKKKKLSGGAIAGIAIGSVLGFVLIMLILFVLCRKRSSRKTRAVDVSTVKQVTAENEKSNVDDERNVGGGGGHTAATPVVAAASAVAVAKPDGKKKLLFFGNAERFFDLEDLLRASAEVLGKGTFGTAYKAVLELGQIVAVKRLKDVTIPEKEFREKIEIVGSMDHKNLVPLRAYYYSGDEKLLVYDYLAYGSLSALLHGNRGAGRTPLNWETRSGIALGSARGIEYLHSRGPNVSHGNIKSSNILLDSNYDAHVSDFGLAQLVGPASTPNRVAGYRAPEVTDIRKVSQKADVYSFGVLLLELLTGKAPTHAVLNEDGVDLPRWVQSVVREEWTAEVFDLELLRYQNIEEEMVQLLELGLDCTAQYPDKRPTITEVVRRIEEIRGPSAREEKDLQPDGIVDPDDEGPPK